MNASSAGLPPLPPNFGCNDGWRIRIRPTYDTPFDAHRIRLPEPTRPVRRDAWPVGQKPSAAPDLDRDDPPAPAFVCHPEARIPVPFAMLDRFGETAGTAPDLPGIAAKARDHLAHRPTELLGTGVRVGPRPEHASARRPCAHGALGDPFVAQSALATPVPEERRWLGDPARQHHVHPGARVAPVRAA